MSTLVVGSIIALISYKLHISVRAIESVNLKLKIIRDELDYKKPLGDLDKKRINDETKNWLKDVEDSTPLIIEGYSFLTGNTYINLLKISAIIILRGYFLL